MTGFTRVLLALSGAFCCGCVGTGPERPLESYRLKRGLSENAPAVLVDVDDTIFNTERGRPMAGAARALRDLARDHVIVYLTARPTHFKFPWITYNREDCEEFLRQYGFPSGPLFTSSAWSYLFRGQGGGKIANLEQISEYGVTRVALAAADRPHDLEAYRNNGHVDIQRTVILLIEEPDAPDPDRAALPKELLSGEIPGSGAAWTRVVAAYRKGQLARRGVWTVSQPAGSIPKADQERGSARRAPRSREESSEN